MNVLKKIIIFRINWGIMMYNLKKTKDDVVQPRHLFLEVPAPSLKSQRSLLKCAKANNLQQRSKSKTSMWKQEQLQ